jgi:hypothetical protein
MLPEGKIQPLTVEDQFFNLFHAFLRVNFSLVLQARQPPPFSFAESFMLFQFIILPIQSIHLLPQRGGFCLFSRLEFVVFQLQLLQLPLQLLDPHLQS